MRTLIGNAITRLESLSEHKSFHVISHFDSDGITSAAIFSRALQRWGKSYTLQIVKGVDEPFIQSLPNDKVLIFLDLASGSLDQLALKNTEVYIFDHHEFTQTIPGNVSMINPHLLGQESISAAAISYLFAKLVSPQNRDLAHLAVIGMVGDLYETHIGRVFQEILDDSEAIVKKGLMLYPSTRPLDKALEYSSSPFIPGVTGSYTGVLELLKDAGLGPTQGGGYKALYELNEEEMTKLVSAVMLRISTNTPGGLAYEHLTGNLFLVKLFNKLEDARELSALINACSRMDSPHVSLGFCLGNKRFRDEAEKIYISYRQNLVSGLKYVAEMEKIAGNNYVILNARDKIKDTIIGTIASIVSHSPTYQEGSIIVALAYNEDKIKVSARIAGRKGRNVRDVLHQAVVGLGSEAGGHPEAAGCFIARTQEGVFLEALQKVLTVEIEDSLHVPSVTTFKEE